MRFDPYGIFAVILVVRGDESFTSTCTIARSNDLCSNTYALNDVPVASTNEDTAAACSASSQQAADCRHGVVSIHKARGWCRCLKDTESSVACLTTDTYGNVEGGRKRARKAESTPRPSPTSPFGGALTRMLVAARLASCRQLVDEQHRIRDV